MLFLLKWHEINAFSRCQTICLDASARLTSLLLKLFNYFTDLLRLPLDILDCVLRSETDRSSVRHNDSTGGCLGTILDRSFFQHFHGIDRGASDLCEHQLLSGYAFRSL